MLRRMLGKILKRLHLGKLGKRILVAGDQYTNEYQGKGKKQVQKKEQEKNTDIDNENMGEQHLSRELDENVRLFKEILGKNADFVVRELSFGGEKKIRVALFYFEGMVDKRIINEGIVKPLMYNSPSFLPKELKRGKEIIFWQQKLIPVGGVKVVGTFNQLLDNCLHGDTIFLLDGLAEGFSIDAKGWENRGIEEPETEAVVRGPREGFTETLGLNIPLLRRRICHPDLVIESLQIGEKTRTKICLAYLKGVVRPELVEEVHRRLQRIDTDAILAAGYIEQYIEDAPFSPFATVANSERPDTVAGKILEGRVAILVDGTPIVLTVPMLLVESFQSVEDYYSRPYYASMIRSLRYLSFFITISAPAVYVVLTTFHQELIPTRLLLTIASAREGIPFPALAEVLMMGIIFEILREAGIRLPRPIGSAISIVGALVIGEAAVSAGLIGAPMIIVISLTAISSFVVPAQTDAVTILRYVLIIAAGFIGAFGFFLVFLGLLIHLASLRSFGVPYFAPFAPVSTSGLKDTVIRAPLWAMLTRPKSISKENVQRKKAGLLPKPPQRKQ